MSADSKNHQKDPATNGQTLTERKSKASNGAAGEQLQLVTFMLYDQAFGGDIVDIQEVTRMSHITRVPHVKDYLRGVTNLRGHIVPTVDLRERLGLQGEELPADEADNRQILIARTDRGLIGYIVDSVREVVTVGRSRIEPTPDDWADENHEYYVGIAKLDEALITIIDFSKVVESEVLLDELKRA